MGGIVALPQRRLSQPQYAAPVDKSHPLAKDVTFFLNGSVPNYNAATGQNIAITAGGSGFSQRATQQGISLYTPDGGWAALPISEDWAATPNTVIALCRVNNIDSPWGGLFAKNAFGTATQFAVGRTDTTSSLYGSVDDTTAVSFGGASIPALADFGVLAFTHSGGASAPMSYYRNGALVGTTSALATQPAGAGLLYLGVARNVDASFDSDVDWIAFVRVARVLSASEIAAYVGNPSSLWGLLKAPSRKIWISSAASGNGVGSAAGLAAATGVGASTAASVGSSSGLAAASGIGASIAAAVGSSAGVASASGVGSSSTGSSGSASGISAASGVGASTAASVGSSAGIASASAVGDSSAPGSTVGSAFGVSGASGVGASIAAAVGSSGGVSSASGVPLSAGQQSSGGYGGIYVSREDRAERRKKQRIELGIIKEEKAPAPALEQFEISNLAKKRPVLVPASKGVDLAQQEALNAELKRLIAIDTEQEEQEILRILMSL